MLEARTKWVGGSGWQKVMLGWVEDRSTLPKGLVCDGGMVRLKLRDVQEGYGQNDD